MEAKPRPKGPIAIDGPAAAGKTTVGKALANRFGFGFLDTGLMYRAFTLAALREGIEPENTDACAALTERLPLHVEVNGEDTRILLGEEEVTASLRDERVETNVSAYSAIPAVRQAMVTRQRALAAEGHVVLAGRDIGTVVLPDAPVKLFLTAEEDERARRRSLQTAEWGAEATEQTSREQIGGRDRVDVSRAASPLRPAEDAIIIDTTALGLDEVIARCIAAVEAPGTGAKSPKSASPRPAKDRSEAAPDRKRLARYVPLFYWFSHYLMKLLLFIITRFQSYGRENVPAKGPLIIASNHLNNLDPIIMSPAVGRKRRIRFLAKVELFRGRWGFFADLFGAFPIRRFEADLGAVLTAERILRGGGTVGMYPEGTRSRSHTLTEFHPGTATLALRTGASILPCGITGTEKLRHLGSFFTQPRIVFRIGEPIPVERVKRPTPEQVSELTERLNTAIKALLPPQYGGTYTG